MLRISLIALAISTTTLPALAQTHGDHSAHAMPMNAAPSTEAFNAINARMHEDMGIEMTGNADLDFARGMIPHHQGAVDMARVVLEHGEDPEIRAFAEQVIAAQEAEIEFLRSWIAAHE